MRCTDLELTLFWTEAAARFPVVIVGGGRWARVWAMVISQARGSGEGVAMVARRDPDDLRRWLNGGDVPNTIKVFGSVKEAVTAVNARAVIVASRPRDHVEDAMAALAEGAHVLVEKPLSDDPRKGGSLLEAARAAGNVIAIGTEFAFLPVFHQCAAALGEFASPDLNVHLTWDDPEIEVRHGSRKVRHEEVGLLDDLLPHALSIFRVFAPFEQPRFQVVDAQKNDNSGRFTVIDGIGSRYELACSSSAESRKRLLRISAADKVVAVDFTSGFPILRVDGDAFPIRPELAALTSTLRLEFGAFVAEMSGKVKCTPITRDIDDHVRIAIELTSAIEKRPDLS